MTFEECILGHVESGKLEKNRANKLLADYEKFVKKYKKEGHGQASAEMAAQDIVGKETQRALEKARNLRQHALKIKEHDKFVGKGPKMHKRVSELYQQAARQGEVVLQSFKKFMDGAAEKAGVNFSGLDRDHSFFKNALRAAMGEATDDLEANKLGKAMRTMVDYAHSRFKSAGGVVGEILNYTGPQIHRADAVRNVSKKEWVDFVMAEDMADLERMIDEDTGFPFETDKLREVLDEVYEDIISDGRYSAQKSLKKGTLGGKKTPFEQRRNQERFIHFKNADAFFKYNARFGTGENGLALAFDQFMRSYARDIGVLETLGPRPDSVSKYMSSKMFAEGVSDGFKSLREAEYRILSGMGKGDVDSIPYKILSGVQNWIRSSVLGSAAISALSDTVFLAATAKVNGLSASRALGNYAKIMAGHKDLKGVARRSGYIADLINGTALSDTRFAGETTGTGFASWLSNATHKASGLHRMTQATMDSISLEFNATIADHIGSKTSWSKLDDDFKDALIRGGLKESDWDNVLKAEVYDSGHGAKFLITQDMRVSDRFDAKTSFDLANKLENITYSLRQMAANEATLTTRAITTGAILGDGRPGTPSRAIGSTIGLFKSFPITVINTHLTPAYQRMVQKGKFDHFMMVTLGTAMVGAVPLLLKDLVKGKTPPDMEHVMTPKFFFAALLQGGGLGLFGDFLFKDASRFGRGFTTEAVGPLMGTVDDIYRATKGNFDKYIDGEKGTDTNFARDTFRILKRNIPVVGSLWYTRLALERLMLDNIERMVDPKFDEKMHDMERKMIKDQGKEFWWRP